MSNAGHALSGALEGGVSGAATGAAVGAAAATVGLGAALGNAIPIPGLGAAIGALVGAVIAAANAGSMSPEDAGKMLADFDAHPEAKLWFLYADHPLGKLRNRGTLHWAYGHAGKKDPGDTHFDIPAWGEPAFEILKHSIDAKVNDATVARIGGESQHAARALVHYWMKDPGKLRDWVKDSTDKASDKHAAKILRRWAGWQWPAHVARQAGMSGIADFSDRAWQKRFMADKAKIEAPRDRKVAGLGSSASKGLGFGLGLVPGLVLGGAVVAGVLALVNSHMQKAKRP